MKKLLSLLLSVILLVGLTGCGQTEGSGVQTAGIIVMAVAALGLAAGIVIMVIKKRKQ